MPNSPTSITMHTDWTDHPTEPEILDWDIFPGEVLRIRPHEVVLLCDPEIAQINLHPTRISATFS